MSPEQPAGIGQILETPLCYSHGERGETLSFYEHVLGLTQVAQWKDGTAFRVGSGVLLLFDRELLAENDSPVARHGTAGSGHVCFVAAPGRYESLRARLAARGVTVEHTHDWGDERSSFYFRDPAGNLLEVANADIWPA